MLPLASEPTKPAWPASEVLIAFACVGNADTQQLQQGCWGTQPLPLWGPGPYLAWVNAHVDSCAISLLTLHPFNVDDVFLSIHLDYLANLLTFVVSSNHLRENTEVNSPHF